MITIDKILGNINKDQTLREKYEDLCTRKLCETVKITRLESRRVRMRKTSDKGTDIALVLPQGSQLKHGDIIMWMPEDEKMVVVEIEPENVAMIKIKNNITQDDNIEVPVKVGHTIGNLHRPIKLEGNKIWFPIQADTELEMFKKLFGHINEHLEIGMTKMVFEPEEGTEIHEH
jgi:urease accessory protein